MPLPEPCQIMGHAELFQLDFLLMHNLFRNVCRFWTKACSEASTRSPMYFLLWHDLSSWPLFLDTLPFRWVYLTKTWSTSCLDFRLLFFVWAWFVFTAVVPGHPRHPPFSISFNRLFGEHIILLFPIGLGQLLKYRKWNNMGPKRIWRQRLFLENGPNSFWRPYPPTPMNVQASTMDLTASSI